MEVPKNLEYNIPDFVHDNDDDDDIGDGAGDSKDLGASDATASEEKSPTRNSVHMDEPGVLPHDVNNNNNNNNVGDDDNNVKNASPEVSEMEPIHELKHGYITSVKEYIQEMQSVAGRTEIMSNEKMEELHSMFRIDNNSNDSSSSNKALTITYEKSQDNILSNSRAKRRKDNATFDGNQLDPSAANIEPFALQCLHLFNGNWTVLKSNENMEFQKALPPGMIDPENESGNMKRFSKDKKSQRKISLSGEEGEKGQSLEGSISPRPQTAIEITEADPKRLLAYSNPEFDLMTKRTFRHPLSFIREKYVHWQMLTTLYLYIS